MPEYSPSVTVFCENDQFPTMKADMPALPASFTKGRLFIILPPSFVQPNQTISLNDQETGIWILNANFDDVVSIGTA